MAVPKRRKSKARRDTRRAQHDKMASPTFIFCPKCQEPAQPHVVCANCGFYRNREIFLAEEEEEETPTN